MLLLAEPSELDKAKLIEREIFKVHPLPSQEATPSTILGTRCVKATARIWL